ncbi:hypothetical protein NQ314_008356 [Rhamnusium bicolor]|uniref:Uncharacterized protein n=1 Tax=Rhamnusium bicolor TaxID=1586634 RepID=A0AAV8YBF0_9CUCU|nr:hypothetical protein NQ314_008356 [Rhamnusium bicolor]
MRKTLPDVCTTSKYSDFSSKDVDSTDVISCMAESNCSITHTLAGETIPITIKNYNSIAPLSFSNLPISKYGTMHHKEVLCIKIFLAFLN